MRPPNRDDAAAGTAAPGDTGQQRRGKHTASATHRVAVLVIKSTGVEVCFSTYDDRREAERVVEQLKTVGCPARIETARATDVAGLTRRTP